MEPSRTSRKQVFDRVKGAAEALHDRNQRIVLFSIGKNSEGERAIRLYGACRSAREAKSYAAAITQDDPVCNIVMAATHQWAPVADNSVIGDPKAAAKHVEEFERVNEEEKAKAEDDFEAQRQAFLSAGPVDPAICKDGQQPPPDDPEPESTLRVEENDEDGDEETHILTSATKRANQRIAIISVLLKPGVQDTYCLRVLKFVDSDEEAEKYIKNTAADVYTEEDIFTVATHEWIWPASTAREIKKEYRDEMLSTFMNPHLSTKADYERAVKSGDQTLALQAAGEPISQPAASAEPPSSLAELVGAE
jgi:hypothetical protein